MGVLLSIGGFVHDIAFQRLGRMGTVSRIARKCFPSLLPDWYRPRTISNQTSWTSQDFPESCSPLGSSQWFTGFCTMDVAPEIGVGVVQRPFSTGMNPVADKICLRSRATCNGGLLAKSTTRGFWRSPLRWMLSKRDPEPLYSHCVFLRRCRIYENLSTPFRSPCRRTSFRCAI